MDEKEKNEINEAVNESLKTILTEYLELEDRIQAMAIWQLKRIADALEDIRGIIVDGVIIVDKPQI